MASLPPNAMAEQARRLLQANDVSQMQRLLQEATNSGDITRVLEQRDEQGKTMLMLAAALDQQEMAVQVKLSPLGSAPPPMLTDFDPAYTCTRSF